jgi:hypothetical protein
LAGDVYRAGAHLLTQRVQPRVGLRRGAAGQDDDELLAAVPADRLTANTARKPVDSKTSRSGLNRTVSTARISASDQYATPAATTASTPTAGVTRRRRHPTTATDAATIADAANRTARNTTNIPSHLARPAYPPIGRKSPEMSR